MHPIIFRHYDIRGIVGDELVIHEVYALTRAIAYYFWMKCSNIRRVVLGFDGRTHSRVMVEYVCAGLRDSGLDVHVIGLCPSPVLYFALHTRTFDAGIMITASHNAKEYNGMKLCIGTTSLWGTDIQCIQSLYRNRVFLPSIHKGALIEEKSILPTYIQWLVTHFSSLKRLPLAIAIDCGHGAAGAVIPAIIDALEFPAVRLLYQEVNGNFPAHEADPTISGNMNDIKTIIQHDRIDVGIGFDGDADRMAAMTDQGVLLPGDQLFALFAQQIAQTHARTSMIFDVKASQGLLELMHQWHVPFHFSPAGHAIVKTYMRKHAAILGGELSCHFIFADRYFGYDDGIYAFLRLLELLQNSGKNLTELTQIFPLFCSSPELRLPCSFEKIPAIIADIRSYFVTQSAHILELDGIRVTMPYGWGLVRASHTKPEITMRFEGKTEQDLRRIQENFYSILSRYFAKELLEHLLQL